MGRDMRPFADNRSCSSPGGSLSLDSSLASSADSRGFLFRYAETHAHPIHVGFQGRNARAQRELKKVSRLEGASVLVLQDADRLEDVSGHQNHGHQQEGTGDQVGQGQELDGVEGAGVGPSE